MGIYLTIAAVMFCATTIFSLAWVFTGDHDCRVHTWPALFVIIGSSALVSLFWPVIFVLVILLMGLLFCLVAVSEIIEVAERGL